MEKIALISGGARGIGRAAAEIFIEQGFKVIILDRDGEELNKTCKQIVGTVPFNYDVSNENSMKEISVRVDSEFGRLDCLVNNAGILVDTLITMLDRATLRDIYEVNVFAVFEMMSYASRIMSKQKSGAIINITSICGDEGGMRGQTAYSSSKGAVIALTKTAAKELGEFNVRVNAVAPGFIDTDMFRSGPREIQKQLVDGVYLNQRVGLPDEVADVCVFLASDKSSYVNGENIRVDGFAHI